MPRDILFYCLGPYLDIWDVLGDESPAFQLTSTIGQREGRITNYSIVQGEPRVDRTQYRETHLDRNGVQEEGWRITWVTNLDNKKSHLVFHYQEKLVHSLDLPYITHGTLSLCGGWFYLKLNTNLHMIDLSRVTQYQGLPPVLKLPREYRKSRIFVHPTTGEIFGARNDQIFRFHPQTRRMIIHDIRLPPPDNPHLKIKNNLHNALMSFNQRGKLELTFWLTVYTMV